MKIRKVKRDIRNKETNLTETKEFFRFEDIVYVRLKTDDFSGLPGDDTTQHNKKIGASFDPLTKGPKSGLTMVEEEILLPDIVGVPADHGEFRTRVRNYWNDIAVKVPHEVPGQDEVGLKLNVSVDFATDEEAKSYAKDPTRSLGNGIPVVLENYVLYRYCLVYNKVANTYEERHTSPKIDFYLYSESVKALKTVKEADLRDKAYAKYLKIKDDLSTTKKVLRLLGEKPDSIEEDQLRPALQSYALSSPDMFIKLTKDGFDLEMHDFVQRGIDFGVFERIPNTEAVIFNGEPLGRDIEAAVAYLKLEDNADTLKRAKVQLESNSKGNAS